MSFGDLECAACGLSLGFGTPGSAHWCSRCAQYSIVRAEHGDFAGVLSALIALGIGMALVLILLALLRG
ncbi:MAG: hypothetical protein ACHQ2Y_04935 [Candidatus Lutacidiplasmatales archaeon]